MTGATPVWRIRVFVVLAVGSLAWLAAAAAGDAMRGSVHSAAASADPLIDLPLVGGDDEEDSTQPAPPPAPAEPAPEAVPPPPPPPEPPPPEAQAAAEEEPSVVTPPGPTQGSVSAPMLQPGTMPAGVEPFAGDAPAPMVAPGYEAAPPLSDAPLAAPRDEHLSASPVGAGPNVPEAAVPDLVILALLAGLLLLYQRRSGARFQPRW